MRKTIAILLLAGLAWGCEAESSPGLVLASFHGLESKDGGCTYTSEPVSGIIFDATLAEVSSQSFHSYLLLQNEFPPHVDPDAALVESQRVTVDSIDVTFEGESWGELPEPIRIPVTGVLLKPGGEHYVPLPLIPPTIAARLVEASPLVEGASRVPLRLKIQANGRTADGSHVQSNELVHGLYVCDSCLLNACGAGMLWLPFCGGAGAQVDGGSCSEIDGAD